MDFIVANQYHFGELLILPWGRALLSVRESCLRRPPPSKGTPFLEYKRTCPQSPKNPEKDLKIRDALFPRPLDERYRATGKSSSGTRDKEPVPGFGLYGTPI